MLEDVVIEYIRQKEERERQGFQLPLYAPEPVPPPDMPMTQSDDPERGVFIIDT